MKDAGYRTIVADPPWPYPEGMPQGQPDGKLAVVTLPYIPMTFEQICALRVDEVAARDCRLFLWTTNRWLDDAFDVLRAWRFKYRQTLVWHKTAANIVASVAPNNLEFVLVATRGAPARLNALPSALYSAASQKHSAKPELWLDHFESISPPPRLEMFARRQRIGWDTWGNEALPLAEVGSWLA